MRRVIELNRLWKQMKKVLKKFFYEPPSLHDNFHNTCAWNAIEEENCNEKKGKND